MMIYLFYRLESGPVKLGANLHLAKQDHTKIRSAILFWFRHFSLVPPFCFGSAILFLFSNFGFLQRFIKLLSKKSSIFIVYYIFFLKNQKYSLFFIKLTLESSQSSIDLLIFMFFNVSFVSLHFQSRIFLTLKNF